MIKSRIEQAFPNRGRRLFDHEKAEMEEFNEKYRDSVTPKPRKFDPYTTAALLERKAIVEYLRGFGFQEVTQLADYIEQGKHLEFR